MVRSQDWRLRGPGFESCRRHLKMLRNFDNSVYSTLPGSFGGGTKSRWSLLSGVMPGEVKYPTQGVNV